MPEKIEGYERLYKKYRDMAAEALLPPHMIEHVDTLTTAAIRGYTSAKKDVKKGVEKHVGEWIKHNDRRDNA